MFENVLLFARVSTPAPPWFNVGHVKPPPENVLATALFMLIVAVDALTVKPVALVVQFHALLPDPRVVHVPLPSVSVLVPAPRRKVPSDTLKLLASSVPFVSVTMRVAPMDSASCSRQVPPTPLNVTGQSNVLPLDVIVLTPDVDPKVSVDAELAVIPLESVRLPKIVVVPGA